ncbi:MAG: CopG family transcriptional regulator [Candidatus Dormibacteraeota bacterium]|nr:CopG family transcriptional regulator [Candidatus Dormibacteraeota bacterium]
MRRLQIYIDAPLDDALGREASRRGVSKAAVIRAALARELNGGAEPTFQDPWDALIGWLDSEPVDDIDAVIYDRKA